MIIDDIYDVLTPQIQNTFGIDLYIDRVNENVSTPVAFITLITWTVPTHIRERRLEVRLVQEAIQYNQIDYESFFADIDSLLVYNLDPIEQIYAIREASDIVSLPTKVGTIEHVKDYTIYSLNKQFLYNS